MRKGKNCKISFIMWGSITGFLKNLPMLPKFQRYLLGIINKQNQTIHKKHLIMYWLVYIINSILRFVRYRLPGGQLRWR